MDWLSAGFYCLALLAAFGGGVAYMKDRDGWGGISWTMAVGFVMLGALFATFIKT